MLRHISIYINGMSLQCWRMAVRLVFGPLTQFFGETSLGRFDLTLILHTVIALVRGRLLVRRRIVPTRGSPTHVISSSSSDCFAVCVLLGVRWASRRARVHKLWLCGCLRASKTSYCYYYSNYSFTYAIRHYSVINVHKIHFYCV